MSASCVWLLLLSVSLGMHPCGSPMSVANSMCWCEQVIVSPVSGRTVGCQEHSQTYSLLNCIYSFVCLVAEACTSWLSFRCVGSQNGIRSSGLTPKPSLWPSSGIFCCASEQTSLRYIPLNRIALLVVVTCPPPSPSIHTLIGWFVFWYKILLCSSSCSGTQYVTKTDLEHTAIPLPHTCSRNLQVWAPMPSF